MMILKRMLGLVLAVMVAILPLQTVGAAKDAAAQIYVSQSGNDTQSGTEEMPVKTIERAKELVSAINTGERDICVNIAEGTYFIDNTLTFTPADGGKDGTTVCYKGSGATTISGGKTIGGWELHDAAANIYKAQGVDFDFRQLYVNGEKMQRAILPAAEQKYASRCVTAYNSETTVGGVTYPKDSIVVERSAVGDWKNLNSVELRVLNAWTDNTLLIDTISYVGEKAVIKLQEPCSTRIFNRPHPNLTAYVGKTSFVGWFENAYEFIDEDGEWYLDKSTDTLYFKAPAAFDMSGASVIAPNVETLISIEGTDSERVKNLEFRSLTFAHSNWTRPSEEGIVGAQAFQYVLTSNMNNEIGIYRAPSAVYVRNGENINFERNSFINIGATALDYHYGDKGGKAVGNTFCEVAGNGISVGKFMCDDLHDFHDAYNPTDEGEICDGQLIENNYLTKIAAEYEGAVGIGGGYPRNLTISHNTLSYMPYSGISVGYGWTSSDNAMRGNKILANNIHHVCLSVCDGATIYTLSKQPESEMAYNYLHDVARMPWHDYGCAGLYLDERTEGYSVHDNAMFDCPGIWQNRTGTNSLQNNSAFYNEDIILASGVEEEYRDILPQEELPQMPLVVTPTFGWSASASHVHSSYGVANAFDGNSDTRYVSGSDQKKGDFFMVDMKVAHEIKRIAFTGRMGTNPDFPADCDIFTSLDGENWGESVASVTDNTNETIDVSFAPRAARYIKIVITKDKAAWWDIFEIRTYEDYSQKAVYSSADFASTLTEDGGAVRIAEFDVIPLKDGIDGVIGHTSEENSIEGWSDCGVTIRFSTAGAIDYCDATGIHASSIKYHAFSTYHCKMYINTDKGHYSVYISENGGAAQILCEKASFRANSKPMASVGRLLARGGASASAREFQIKDYSIRDALVDEILLSTQSSVTLYSAAPRKATAFFADYSGENTLEGVEMQAIDTPDNDVQTFSAQKAFQKLFIWDTKMHPLTY